MPRISPSADKSISALIAYFSSPEFKEQAILDNTGGNIGTTLSVKYTLVPLLLTHLSRVVFSLT